MKSNNQQAMMSNLINQNPQNKQAWQITQNILNNKNMTKEQQLEYACKQNGLDVNQVKNTLKTFGINL